MTATLSLRALCAGALIALGAPCAFAAPLPARPFVYSTSDASVADALAALGSAAQVPVRIEGDVHGRIAGRFRLTPEQFLDVLATTYGLIWHYDGTVVHVEPASRAASLVMRLNYASAADVVQQLERDGTSDPRMPLGVDTQRNTLAVSGPSDYTARVSDAVQGSEDRARTQIITAVRVVRLNVATAADRTLVVGGRAVTTPGVAARLRRRVRGPQASAPVTAGNEVQLREYDVPLPIFEADAPTNSILVRDRPDRIEDDQALIEQFDRKPDVVTIQAYVFDIDAQAFGALGLDAAGARRGHGWRPGELVVHDAGAALLERVDALRRSGEALVRIERNLPTFDHAPTSVGCREAQLMRADGAAHAAATTPSPHANTSDVSLVIEPDLGGAGGAAQLELVTRVRDDNPAHDATAGGAAGGGSGTAGSWDEVRTLLAPGDGLVLLDPPGREARVPDSRRLVVVVPKIVG